MVSSSSSGVAGNGNANIGAISRDGARVVFTSNATNLIIGDLNAVPDIYAKVGTAGAICARFIRGSNTAVSNHSWGTAIDLTLEGQLDPFADGGTQFGLLILAEYFNDEGWFWGAAYNREDSMHFEVGAETLQTWAAAGLLAAQ